MASGNTDPFLKLIEKARVDLREKVARAHQLLEGRETALLSEIQQLEDTYRGEGVDKQIHQLRITKEQTIATLLNNEDQNITEQSVALLDARMRELEANLETARDRMVRVELEWDGNLEGVLSTIGSIRVSASPDYNEKGSTVSASDKHISTRKHGSTESGSNLLLSHTPVNHSFPPVTEEKIMNIFPQPKDDKNTQVNPTSRKDSESYKELNSSIPTSFRRCNSASSSPVAHSYGDSCSNPPFTPSAYFLMIKIWYSIPNTSIEHFTNSLSNNIIRPCLSLTPDKPQQACNSVIEEKVTRGLKNLGNTCYMNCILQCLSHTIPLRQFYVSDEYRQHLNNRGDLSKAFKRVMAELWKTTSDNSSDLYDLRKEVIAKTDRFSDDRQHDAHEFMRFLLNELHEEINRASVEGRKSPADNETLGEACARYLTWEDSRISELFSGMLQSEVCCTICRNQSNTYIPFFDLALSIPKSWSSYLPFVPAVQLTKCLESFIKKETLIEEERPYCDKCRKLTPSTKQVCIAKLPIVLVIQLKRFSNYPECTKISTPVKFDDTWELKDTTNNTHTYSLYGIVCHSGDIYGGHYIAYCKHGDNWRRFNDSRTSIVRWKYVKEQEAYILFYKKVVII